MVEDVERKPVRQKRRHRKALYFTSEKGRFRVSVGKKSAHRKGKKYHFEYYIRNCEDFDTISTMATENEEGVKNKEHANDCISKSEMKTS